MPKGSGRKSSTEWTEVLESRSKSRVVCKYCQKEISKKVERVRSHLNKCKNKGASTSKKNVEDVESMSISSDDEDRELEHENKSKQENGENLATLAKNKNLDEFVIKTTVEQKEKIDKMVAKFFFGCNIAFNVAEQKTFKEMISVLRPGYIAPNRKQLSEKYLPQICTDIESLLKKELEYTSVTLILDGWSNTSNDAIIASSIHTGHGVYLIDAEDAGTKKKTSEYCVEVANRAIDLIKELYGKTVFACCTDNENKMKRMKQILSETKGIVTYGCSAHYMNLLYKDIIPTNLTKHIIELQKFFRNHHQPHGWLKEKGGAMPQIPNETRWNSYEDCLKTFISNYHLYNQIRSEHLEDFKSYANINAILNNVALYSEAVELEKQLSILSTSLDKMQSDQSFLTDAVVCWNNLLSNENFANNNNHKENIKKMFK
ncbi:unnamed protein product [Brassicogethes aeneus]|uniref:BED-type domain-containing protein n=1 Tax=Brassicogethes aeneus TaxID=1431903 RepID=A0A9P0BGP5_BRAAE|nr:unnamed protein product [Brassicogethes aeneus]